MHGGTPEALKMLGDGELWNIRGVCPLDRVEVCGRKPPDGGGSPLVGCSQARVHGDAVAAEDIHSIRGDGTGGPCIVRADDERGAQTRRGITSGVSEPHRDRTSRWGFHPGFLDGLAGRDNSDKRTGRQGAGKQTQPATAIFGSSTGAASSRALGAEGGT